MTVRRIEKARFTVSGIEKARFTVFCPKIGKSCLLEFAFPFPGSIGRASAEPARRTALGQASRLPFAKPAGSPCKA